MGREGYDALVADGLVLRVPRDVREERVVVEQRPDVDDVRVEVSQCRIPTCIYSNNRL